ncbi:hypothetical protein BJG93_23825 [Paraburkholderia sprentiae WSM5005]|uniref:Extensin n=1 Tax=Paraburkholderia sprentiae WSM5005 TaxID=754502 RepID=A0A1I9YQC4_9BURK|nr:hypothetical protein [Paraburkholderia sprentiae]APA88397.1 hypothetical protein BJG93_23825 [Paraburkholderia sprentiae WSM5005]
MTNTGKMMIVGLLVVDAGVAGYLLYPRDDQVPAVTGAVTRGTTGAVEPQPQTDTTRAAGASVMPAQPMSPPAPQSALAQTGSAARVPAQALAPAPSPPATAAAPALGATPDSGQTAGGRIDNAAPPAVNPAAVAHARAKLQSYAEQKNPSRPQYGPRIDQTQGHRRDDMHPNGANSVAAMLTDQLVKESAKPDPSLPMPSGITVPMSSGNATGAGAGTGRGTNPVASAMTDQLVRESSKVTPTPPAAAPPAAPPVIKP